MDRAFPSTVEKCSILTMTERQRAKQRDEIQTGFENGTVFSANEETLLTYLKSLCNEEVAQRNLERVYRRTRIIA